MSLCFLELSDIISNLDLVKWLAMHPPPQPPQLYLYACGTSHYYSIVVVSTDWMIVFNVPAGTVGNVNK